MPSIREDIQSRRTSVYPWVQERIYHVLDTADEKLALKELGDAAPETVEVDGNELIRRTLRVEPIWVDDVSDKGVWIGRAKFSPQGLGTPPSDPVFTFDTSGGSEHITQSLGTVGVYAVDGVTPPNFDGAIGVTRDAVEGTDIIVPTYQWTEMHVILNVLVTEAYKKQLQRLTGRTNLNEFRGHEPGEALFLGAAGSQRGIDDWGITFRFAAKENRTDFSIGQITGISQRGWDHLWVYYSLQEDTNSVRVVRKPLAVYVERVALEGAFAYLGIG